MSQDDLFSIRQMIELTGLSEFTIRGWENRYATFQPRRGETGRREYNKSDVERALLLRELLKRGHKIGKIAKLSNPKLKKLFELDPSQANAADSHDSSKLIAQAMELVSLQKWTELKDLIRKVPAKDTKQLIHGFFLPCLKALSLSVEAKVISVSQEHIFSALLKEKIYAALSEAEGKRSSSGADKRIQFVLATPEGDYHEMGLLLAHLLIRSFGLASLYLGPHTPAKDLAESAVRFNASHILIVSTVSKRNGASQETLSFISELQAKIGSRLQILIAGSQAPLIMNQANASLLNIRNFQEFEIYLEKLKGRK